MDGELIARDGLFAAGILKELPGELRAFAMGNHPADDVAAEDIEHDIKIEVSPLGRAKQFGYIPAPELVGGRGEQFMLGVRGMGKLIAALTGLASSSEQAVHGARRAMIVSFVQQ